MSQYIDQDLSTEDDSSRDSTSVAVHRAGVSLPPAARYNTQPNQSINLSVQEQSTRQGVTYHVTGSQPQAGSKTSRAPLPAGWENHENPIFSTTFRDPTKAIMSAPKFSHKPMNRFTFLALFLLVSSSSLLTVALIGHGWANSTKLPANWVSALNVTASSDLAQLFMNDQYIKNGTFALQVDSAVINTNIGLFESCTCISLDAARCSTVVSFLLSTRYSSVIAIMLSVLMMGVLVFDFSQWSYHSRIHLMHLIITSLLALVGLISLASYARLYTTEYCGTQFSQIGELGYAFFLRILEIVVAIGLAIWWALHVSRKIIRTAKAHQYITLLSALLLTSVCCSTVFRGWVVNERFQFGLWNICQCTRIQALCPAQERYFIAAICFACSTTALSGLNLTLLLHIGCKPPPWVHTVLAWCHSIFLFGEFAIIWRWIGIQLCGLISFEQAGGHLSWTFICCVVAFGLSLLYTAMISMRHAGVQIKGLEDDFMNQELKDLST